MRTNSANKPAAKTPVHRCRPLARSTHFTLRSTLSHSLIRSLFSHRRHDTLKIRHKFIARKQSLPSSHFSHFTFQGHFFFFKVTHSKSLFLALQIKSRHVLKDHNSRFTLASVISDDISATDDELAWAPESPTKSNAMRCSVARCIQS